MRNFWEATDKKELRSVLLALRTKLASAETD